MGGLRLPPSPPSWESVRTKLTPQGLAAKTNHRASPAGSPEALCSPQSSGARPLISDGPSLSSFSQEAALLSVASQQMEKQECGEDERAGSPCLGNPLCSHLLAGSQMLSPAYRGMCVQQEGGGWSTDQTVLSAHWHLCLPPLIRPRRGRGRGRAQSVSAPRPSPWSGQSSQDLRVLCG